MTPSPKKNILLVEDNDVDAEIVSRYLSMAGEGEYRLARAESLGEGQELHSKAGFDLIVLDQNLPDSVESQTLGRCLTWARGTPIVVLTGHGDEKIGLDRIRQGAQDYLVKGAFDESLFMRVVRYVIERHVLQKDMTVLKLKEQKALEIKALEDMDSVPLGSTAPRSLRGSAPVYYSDLISRYEGFLESALDQRIYLQDRSLVSESIRVFTSELARFGAGPREIVEIHSTALERRLKGQSELKAQAYLEEARLLLLETMGAMVQTYRSKFTIKEGVSSHPK